MSERTADAGDDELRRIFEDVVGDSVVTIRQDESQTEEGRKGVIDTTAEDRPRTGTAGRPREDPLADAISDPEPASDPD